MAVWLWSSGSYAYSFSGVTMRSKQINPGIVFRGINTKNQGPCGGVALFSVSVLMFGQGVSYILAVPGTGPRREV